MKIAIGSDHGGFELKSKIIEHFKDEYEMVDKGCFSNESCDYPIFSYAVAKDVSEKNCDLGIVICTNGVGVSMVANKVKGCRAALCLNKDMVEHAKLHNDANILALGAINQPLDEAIEFVKTFVNTPFSNEERHLRRVNEIIEIEEK
ncbi:MAG: ribose 5-phosphate isomerase B [Gammaproteobacteria bacterium]|nr:ribose 5-phosphate isomerase B [Gammaproteobacteria bacterium]